MSIFKHRPKIKKLSKEEENSISKFGLSWIGHQAFGSKFIPGSRGIWMEFRVYKTHIGFKGTARVEPPPYNIIAEIDSEVKTVYEGESLLEMIEFFENLLQVEAAKIQLNPDHYEVSGIAFPQHQKTTILTADETKRMIRRFVN